MSSTSITESYITSQDGTRIGYLQRGSGPGLVLVQGAMGTAYNYDDLANVLASSFTVYTPDRRGRGMSPKPYTADYTIARDVEDIDALLAATGASRVFGLSSGAMITLEAVRTLPRITQAAVYEPPFYRDGISHTGIQALNAEIESGNLGTGLVTTLATTQMVPAADKLPKPIARILGGFALWVDDRRPGPYARIRNLLPSVQYDFNVVSGMEGKMESLKSIEKPMLLLSGTKSQTFLLQSIRDVKGVLPQAKHVEFTGLDHSGAWNASRGGSPAVVAEALREFFA